MLNRISHECIWVNFTYNDVLWFFFYIYDTIFQEWNHTLYIIYIKWLLWVFMTSRPYFISYYIKSYDIILYHIISYHGGSSVVQTFDLHVDSHAESHGSNPGRDWPKSLKQAVTDLLPNSWQQVRESMILWMRPSKLIAWFLITVAMPLRNGLTEACKSEKDPSDLYLIHIYDFF